MPGTYLNYPFDEDIFVNRWFSEPDLVKTAILNSGVMVEDPLIAAQLRSSGNYGSIPFYKTLDGTPVNHNGATDITSTETEADYQSFVAYGRDIAWTARDFVGELSGADPMGHIISQTARYWAKYRQKKIIAILGAIFGITGNAAWTAHSVEKLSTTATPTKISATDLNDLATDTLGDNKDAYKLAIMHSSVARTLENLQVLEYWKQTDSNGLQRTVGLASANGYTVVIDDGVPVETVGGAGDNKALKKYTTYLLGTGVLRHCWARQDVPVEAFREPLKNNGQETLVTRIRECIHPNGFSFTIPTSGWTNSPTDAQLEESANWSLKFPAKAIPIAKLVTNG